MEIQEIKMEIYMFGNMFAKHDNVQTEMTLFIKF